MMCAKIIKMASIVHVHVVVLFLLAIAATSFGGSSQFSEWMVKYHKKYAPQDASAREVVYKSNLQHIQRLNLLHKDRGIVFAVNQFADLSPDDFRSLILMRPHPPPTLERGLSLLVEGPPSFDWRVKGAVTEVKDQGSVGSCWAFSTVGNVEGQWALTSGNLTSLSAEQLVDCDATQDPHNAHTDCGVFGGWPYLAYQYIQATGGIESEESYSYCSGSGKCFPCQAPGYNKTRCGPPVPSTSCQAKDSCAGRLNKSKFIPGLKLKGWRAIEKNETVIASELVSTGPLSIAMNAEALQFYHSGVWDPILSCDPTSLDHAVLIVGYGTSTGLFSKPYWTIKNSWGSKWGEGGYFRMVRGKGKCGIDQQVTSAQLDANNGQ